MHASIYLRLSDLFENTSSCCYGPRSLVRGILHRHLLCQVFQGRRGFGIRPWFCRGSRSRTKIKLLAAYYVWPCEVPWLRCRRRIPLDMKVVLEYFLRCSSPGYSEMLLTIDEFTCCQEGAVHWSRYETSIPSDLSRLGGPVCATRLILN